MLKDFQDNLNKSCEPREQGNNMIKKLINQVLHLNRLCLIFTIITLFVMAEHAVGAENREISSIRHKMGDYQRYEIRVEIKRGESEEVVAYLEKIEVKPAVKVPKPAYGTNKGKKITNSLGMEFVFILPGTFMMGSPSDEPERSDDEKQHQVKLTREFYMQTTEITQGQWKAVMGSNPSHFKSCGENCPVEKISWNDVQDFIKKLNRLEGTGRYRLPTEAEWEYACRAGTNTPFSFGKCLSADQANYDGNYPLSGCSKGKYRKKTVPVASFSPNNWGLYDMHGNVWEWCQDWYDKYPTGSVTDPKGSVKGSVRVLRGGGWGSDAWVCRSAFRGRYGRGYRFTDFGFRLVLSPGQ